MLVHTTALAATALLLEACVGYPQRLYAAIGHPVSWMGWLLNCLERRWNRAEAAESWRRAAGVGTLLILLAATAAVCIPLDVLSTSGAGWILAVIAAATLPAQRSLDTHVRTVADSLDTWGLEAGRTAVSHIVGRNTEALDESGVCRAAIESLAENFSDGIVAPAFWLTIGGVTGGALYKAINTADSMIGHRSDRYRAFGWAAARLDDLVNLPASRLSALWLVAAAVLVGADAKSAIACVCKDARHHRSPNAGWPEAAMAGALGIALSGPRVYGTTRVEDRFIGGTRQDLTSADVRCALRLYRVAAALQLGCLVCLSVILSG